MITKRLFILWILVAAGMSSIWLLPKRLASPPVGIVLDLPDSIGQWWGSTGRITQKEIDTLGPHTEFARKSYSNGRGDIINVTIVLAGEDMNQSIHRPERCLPSQGWTVINSSKKRLPLDGKQVLEVTRLHNVRNLSEQGQKPVQLYNLDYYWFVGHTETTSSHVARLLIDMRDRLTKGYSQRWAYITVTANITSYEKFGRDERATDELLQAFIRDLAPRIHRLPEP